MSTNNAGPRRNRVDPWGDLHAVSGRGLLTGNRGCLVDAGGLVVRHQRGTLWIACVTELRGRRQPLAAPGRWTPIFFLDEAVALAAGHRPCAYCRRTDYRAYNQAVARSVGTHAPLLASELNRRLAIERYDGGRGLARAAQRRTWTAPIDALPVGTVIVGPKSTPCLLIADHLLAFSFDGWIAPSPRPCGGDAMVLTPPTSLAALSNGYRPLLHPTADAGIGRPLA